MFKRAVHPGEILKDELAELGVTPTSFARHIGVPPNRVSQIIAGKRSITIDTAKRFGQWFGMDPQFWMNLQTQFDLSDYEQPVVRENGLIATEKNGPNRRTILELSCVEAREFFLTSQTYCTLEIPKYFQFGTLLNGVAEVLAGESLSGFQQGQPRNYEGVNHTIMHNKDGRYAWRPLELIHPALYVSLAQKITESANWEHILGRFKQFSENNQIRCVSIPVQSLSEQKNKAEQITEWWVELEQASIALSLDYQYLIQTDIVDCYASIYIHSIPWALHGKEQAKKKENKDDLNLLGNVIDARIRDMQFGQSNGIPQGPVLMDFIAEMVLGYADTELTKRCANDAIEDYRILRYRDDYRVFVNNPQEGDRILKHLTEVLIDLGLQLNPSKTAASSEVVRSSIKDEKLNWMFRKSGDRNLQRSLLIIHDHSLSHPNSGSLARAMGDFHKRIHRLKRCDSPLALIAIVIDIVYRNPRVYSSGAAVFSDLIKFMSDDLQKHEIIEKVRTKFSQVPNSGHMNIWLQRITYPIDPTIGFAEPLCRLVCQEDEQIWNNDWISSRNLRSAIDPKKVVDRDRLRDMEPTISPEEIALFLSRY